MADSGRLIHRWRHAQTPRVTLQQLASDIGTSKVSISRIENGKQAVTSAMGKRLAARTGISLAQLCPDLAREFGAAQ